jgi:hypothetical protein
VCGIPTTRFGVSGPTAPGMAQSSAVRTLKTDNFSSTHRMNPSGVDPMPRVLLRLSLVGMLTVLVTACAVQSLPPLARVVGTEAQSMAPLIAGGAGLGLGAGILATMRRRRLRRGAATAAWSVLADIPGQHDAAFSLAPVVGDPPAPHVDSKADAPERGGDGMHGEDAETSWLGALAEPDDEDAKTSWPSARAEPDGEDAETSWPSALAEPDDDATAPPSPPSAAQAPDAPETPWWADETSGNQAVDEKPDLDDADADDDTIDRARQAARPFDTSERR